MEKNYVFPLRVEEIEALITEIEALIDAAEEEETRDISAAQHRAIMLLQQFYRKLLSDFSPHQYREIRAFLRSNNVPLLREALRIKPAKLPERLSRAIEGMDVTQEKRAQLQDFIKRLKIAVNDVDSAVYSSLQRSGKSEEAQERLLEIQETLEQIVSSARRHEHLLSELQVLEQHLQQMNADDIEAIVEGKRRAMIETVESDMLLLSQRLEASERELEERKELFKEHLKSSGKLMNTVVTLLPRMKQLISSMVKSEDASLSIWDFEVARKHLDRFLASIEADGSEIELKMDEVEGALDYFLSHSDVIGLYEDIKRRIYEIQEMRSRLETLNARKKELLSAHNLKQLRAQEEVRLNELIEQREKIISGIERAQEEGLSLFNSLGVEDMDDLKREVERLKKRL